MCALCSREPGNPRESHTVIAAFYRHYNAIDGNLNTVWSTCAHTASDLNPYWRLDLGKTNKIFSVNITNYRNVNLQLVGAEIRIGDTLENNGNSNPRYFNVH